MRTKALSILAVATLAVAAQETRKGPEKPVAGKPAPAFRLNDHEGNAASVGGEKEDGTWTVLAFFPKAMTPG